MLLKTKEEILQNMLNNIPSDYEKQIGSFIWDVLSATAVEISDARQDFYQDYQQTFIDDAIGEDLEKRTSEMGITRLAATQAIGEVEFTGSPGAMIPIGSMVSTTSGTQYVTTEQAVIDSDGNVSVSIAAVNSGSSGNVPANVITLIPVTLPGVISVTNLEPTYGGEDTETDEELRERYFDSIKNQSTDGNIAQYKKWAEEFAGIGRVRIFPLWNGANTVKISILDSDNKTASSGLIEDFQSYIDPDAAGLGNGVSPIGAKVTVSTATPVIINVTANVVLTEGFTEIVGVDEAISQYFSDLAYSKNTLSYMGLGAVILSVPSVDQIQNLLVNGSTADITLTDEQIFDLGSTTWTVITP